MTEYDIRSTSIENIKSIRFADQTDHENCGQTDVIMLDSDNRGNAMIRIQESNNSDYVRINSVKHAQNLIKALEKAIELKWVE